MPFIKINQMANIQIKSSWFKQLIHFIFFIVSAIVTAQCPTVDPGDEIQSFCATPDQLTPALRPQVGDLVATDNGGGIFWYINPTGGSPLANNINLNDNTLYYADDGTESCPVRQSVQVFINGEPPTNHDRTVGRCSSENNTVDQLDADGTNIEWYDAQIGGNLLPGSTPLVDNTEYWVQQTDNGCTSRRLPTRVTIIDPGPPTGDAEQFFCFDPANPVVFQVADLSATGTEVRWYADENSTTPLDATTVLVDDENYFATQTSFPCESTDRLEIIVRIDTLSDPGMDGTLDLCDSSTASINLFDQLNGSPDTSGTWSGPFPTTNSDQGTLDTSVLDAGSYTFTYTHAVVNACPESSATVTITVQEDPNAGEDGALDICTSEPTVDLFTLLGGTPDAGGTWFPTLDSGTGDFDPSVDSPGTYTYTVAATSPCTVDDTATITVTVNQAPESGNDASLEICENDPPLDLFTLLGPNADTGGTWSPALTSGTGVFDPNVDSSDTYTYSMPPTASCPGDTADVTVTVNEQRYAGEDATVELCRNDAPTDLFSFLGNNPDAGGTWTPALASTTGVFEPGTDSAGTYIYTVGPTGACPSDTSEITVSVSIERLAGNNATITVCGSDAAFDLFPLLGASANTGGTWSGPSPLANADTGTFDPSGNITGTYTYTVVGTGACEDVRSNVVVTVINPTPTLITDGNIFCIADGPTIAELKLNVLPENNGTINIFDTINGTTPLNDTDALINGSTYFISETDEPSSCEGTNRLTVTIQINDPATPQLSNSAAEFCLIDSPVISDLNSFIDLGTNIIWFDAPNNGTQFNDTDTLVTGTYYAIEEDINGCRSAASTGIDILINNNPPPTLNAGGNALCGVEMPTIAELEANLSTDAGLTVIWYDTEDGGTALNSTDLLLDNTTYYAATLNAVTACESNDRLEIEVDLTNCDLDEYPLLLPDGFSPNGDGINDTYDLLNVQFLYEDYTIEIYNRYGNLLFVGSNAAPPWDGTSNQSGASGDKVVPNGVYFYIFNYNRDNVQPVQGRIYLNR